MSKLLKLIFTKRNNSIFFLVVDHSCSKEKDGGSIAAATSFAYAITKKRYPHRIQNSQAVKKCSPKEPR